MLILLIDAILLTWNIIREKVGGVLFVIFTKRKDLVNLATNTKRNFIMLQTFIIENEKNCRGTVERN